MGNFLKVGILIVFTGAVVFLIAARIAALGSEYNWFNKNYRAKFAKYGSMRQLLGLHDPGDAVSDYVGAKFKTIKIEVDSMDGLLPHEEVFDRVAQVINEVTGKHVEFYISDDSIPFKDQLSEETADQTMTAYDNTSFATNQAHIHVLILSERADNTDLIGITHGEYGIIIYANAIRRFTANIPVGYDEYMASTILHEFGHLLGLDHNEELGCLMNTHAEADDQPQSDPRFIVTKFCARELQEIHTAK